MNAAATPERLARGPALGRLPRESRADALGRNRLLALLACARIDATTPTSAGLEAAPWPALRMDLDSRWGPIGFVPLRDGAPAARLCTPDGIPDLRSTADAIEAAEPALLALEVALDTPLVPRGLAPPPHGDRIEVVLALPDGSGARLDASASVLARLPRPAWIQPPEWVFHLAVCCRVRLGSCRLSAPSAAALGAGDVLLTLLAVTRPATVRIVAPDGAQALATFDPGGHTLRFGPPFHMDTVMPTDPIPDVPAAADAADWTRQSIELAFELPRANVPLGVLAGMQPGAVIPLAADAAAIEVVVVNGGRAVGRGRLVAVGDGLGVRLSTPLSRLA